MMLPPPACRGPADEEPGPRPHAQERNRDKRQIDQAPPAQHQELAGGEQGKGDPAEYEKVVAAPHLSRAGLRLPPGAKLGRKRSLFHPVAGGVDRCMAGARVSGFLQGQAGGAV